MKEPKEPPLDEGIEIWMVELPGKIRKCFSLDKAGAFEFAQKLGKDAMVWDMMSDPHKGNYGNKSKEKG